MDILSVNNLDVYYGNNHILKDINYNFKINSITSIIGSSGCGKSTFLRTINKSINLEENVKVSGKILYNGSSINDISDENIKSEISLVSQMPIVFPFSIYKNLSFVINYHYKLDKDETSNQIINVLKTVKLYDEVKDKLYKSANNLSGGQQQRLSIARNLLTKPKILLLDEPCSALDIANQLYIEDLLIELKNTITIIIVTHNIKEAKRISDDCIFIKDGSIIEYGRDLLEKPQNIETKKFLNLL